MTTDAINALQGTSGFSAASAISNGAMGKEEFLKLLVAQLQHQDPLQPMENTEFIAQLAQFSSLEQLMTVNNNLQMLEVAQASQANGQIASLIGKEIEAKTGVLVMTTPGPQNVNFDLGSAAKDVTVKITDSKGNLVRSIDVGSRSGGLNTVVWDGKDSLGNLMPAANYKVEIAAKDSTGQAINVSTQFKGIVTGVTYNNGLPLLEIGNTSVQVNDVIAVRQPVGSTSATSSTSATGSSQP